MSTSKRLAKIEDRLTAAEAVVSWTHEAYKHKSLTAYVTWLRSHPEELWPLEKLPGQVSRGVKALAKGETQDEVSAKTLKAEKNLVFLLILHQFLNLAVARELQVQSRQAQQVFEMLRELGGLGCLREELCRERLTQQHQDLLAFETEIAERHRILTARCLLDAREALFRIRVMEAAAEYLSRRYLLGQHVLFPDLRSGIAILLHTLRGQLDPAKTPSHSEPEMMRILARQALGEAQAPARAHQRPTEGPDEEPNPDEAAAVARRIALRARAETLYLLGDNTGSRALLDQYLETGLPPKPRPSPTTKVKSPTTTGKPRVAKSPGASCSNAAAAKPGHAASPSKAAATPVKTASGK